MAGISFLLKTGMTSNQLPAVEVGRRVVAFWRLCHGRREAGLQPTLRERRLSGCASLCSRTWTPLPRGRRAGSRSQRHCFDPYEWSGLPAMWPAACSRQIATLRIVRILLAMRSLDPSEGGPTTAAFGLAQGLSRRGHEVTLTAHDDGRSTSPDVTGSEGLDIRLFPLSTRFWEHSRCYARWLQKSVKAYDLVIINSMWRSHVHYAAKACRAAGVPYIIRPHGCLTQSDLAHHAMRKRAYWLLKDRRICQRAAFVHCTSEQEAADARLLNPGRVEVIPLGVDRGMFGIDGGVRSRTSVLFLGRIAEKKGVDILVRSLAEEDGRQAGLTLDVVGGDHRGLQAGLEELARELQVSDRVAFHGHADANKRAQFLATAGVFALASKDENFGISTAEAMAAGLPVVITPHVSHAPLVQSTHSGLVVDRDAREFASALRSVATLPQSEFAAMGAAARAAAEEHFSWDRSAYLLERALTRCGDRGRDGSGREGLLAWPCSAEANEEEGVS